jgi:hypothetical protein
VILPILASQVTKITGVNHWGLAQNIILKEEDFKIHANKFEIIRKRFYITPVSSLF